jgi:hypothetical protein
VFSEAATIVMPRVLISLHINILGRSLLNFKKILKKIYMIIMKITNSLEFCIGLDHKRVVMVVLNRTGQNQGSFPKPRLSHFRE